MGALGQSSGIAGWRGVAWRGAVRRPSQTRVPCRCMQEARNGALGSRSVISLFLARMEGRGEGGARAPALTPTSQKREKMEKGFLALTRARGVFRPVSTHPATSVLPLLGMMLSRILFGHILSCFRTLGNNTAELLQDLHQFFTITQSPKYPHSK